MFDNVGSKIKKLAKIFCWLGIAASVISGIAIIIASPSAYNHNSLALTGVLTVALGCLFSWICSFFIYGFGQLIENTDYIRSNMQRRD